jgi:hypothetical protein
LECRPRKYWNDLKKRLVDEGSELSEKIGQLKMVANDGKDRLTDVADLEQLFRLIQSIPSKNVEPLKIWLAEVGKDRINEMYDPEITVNRALETYRKEGIYEYVLTQNENKLNIRTFSDRDKRIAYEKQKGICVKCKQYFEITKMQADHITPWSKGGKTVAENCQMLCDDCNRRKSNI